MNAVAIAHYNKVQYANLNPAYWIVVLAIFGLISFATENSFLTFVSLACIPIFVVLLWRIGEPPILFIAVFSQWTQAVAKLFDANIRGITLADYHGGWTIDEAVMISLVALLFLSVGMRVALVRLDRRNEHLEKEINSLSITKIWYAYIFLLLVGLFAREYVWLVPRLSQILLAVLSLKWVLFFILGMAIFSQRRKMYLLVIATAIEVLLGATGFFSGFHQVFVLLLLVTGSYIDRYSWKSFFTSTLLVLTLVSMWILWSAVKVEYRDYLNQGTGTQTVRVPWGERTSKIFELYGDVNQDDFLEGIETFAKRVSYVDYLARVLEIVPESVPYSGGELWGAAIMHVIMPRVLFPDKKALVSETYMTEKYTQYRLIEQGGLNTNIPMGYLTESYIDFGRVFMFVPITLIGFFLGCMFRYFVSSGREILFGFAITVAVLLNAHKVEIGATKLVGGVLMVFIVMALINKFVVPKLHRAISAN